MTKGYVMKGSDRRSADGHHKDLVEEGRGVSRGVFVVLRFHVPVSSSP